MFKEGIRFSRLKYHHVACSVFPELCVGSMPKRETNKDEVKPIIPYSSWNVSAIKKEAGIIIDIMVPAFPLYLIFIIASAMTQIISPTISPVRLNRR